MSLRADAPGPVGRNAELTLLRSFVEQAADRGAALLVTGGPGTGKTALLATAAREADRQGTLVLAAAGIRSESGLGFAGLHQLLLPVVGELERLSAVHRHALAVALGYRGGPAAGRLVVSTAALSLLRLVAHRRPVLLLVDDVPWLDRASADVLGFAARRLAGSPIGFLGSARTGTTGFFDPSGLPELQVGPPPGPPHALPPLPDVEDAGSAAGSMPVPRRPPLSPGAHDRPRLVPAAGPAHPGPGGSLPEAVATAYGLLTGDGDVDTAHRLLTSALELGAGDDGALPEALHTLLLICSFSGRDSPWRPFEAALGRLGPRVPPVLAVSRSTFADPARATAAQLAALDALVADAGRGVVPARAVEVGIAAIYVDRLAGCREPLERAARDAGASGDVSSQISALLLLCHDALAAGRWDDARRGAEQGIRLADEHGHQLLAWPGHHCLAALAALEGDDGSARTQADRMAAWAAPRGARTVEHYAVHARLLAALARQDFEEAYRQGATVAPAGEFPAHVPIALWVALDLVESATRTGRRAEAAAHVAALRRLELSGLSPRLALVTAGAAGMAAGEETATGEFERALAVPGGDAFPFEHARVRLAYGEHLRRTRHRGAAREQLAAAQATFRALGAAPWAARAEAELRLTGRDAAVSGTAALTQQEEQIALLAAAGLTNKEIGARLYLSPRTVGAHLYRIFPKLGIGARAALRDALTARSADPAVLPDPPPNLPLPRRGSPGSRPASPPGTPPAGSARRRSPGP